MFLIYACFRSNDHIRIHNCVPSKFLENPMDVTGSKHIPVKEVFKEDAYLPNPTTQHKLVREAHTCFLVWTKDLVIVHRHVCLLCYIFLSIFSFNHFCFNVRR